MQEDTKISVDELEAHIEMRNVATGEVVSVPVRLVSFDGRYAHPIIDYTQLPAGEWSAGTGSYIRRKD